MVHKQCDRCAIRAQASACKREKNPAGQWREGGRREGGGIMEEGELDEPVRPPYKGKRGGRNERCRRSLIKRSVRFSTLWPPFPWPHLSFVPKRPTPTDDLKEPPIIRQKVDRPIRKSVSLPLPSLFYPRVVKPLGRVK